MERQTMAEAFARRQRMLDRQAMAAQSRRDFAAPFAATAGGPGGAGTPTVSAFLIEYRAAEGFRLCRGAARNLARIERRRRLRKVA